MFKTTWGRKVMPKKNQIKAISKPRFRIPDPTRKTIACNFYLLEIRIIVVGIVTLLLFISCFNCIYLLYIGWCVHFHEKKIPMANNDIIPNDR